MKYLFLATGLALHLSLSAQHLVVFAKEEACDLDSGTGCKPPNDKASAFYDACRQAVGKTLIGATYLPFEIPPLQWWRTIAREDHSGLSCLTTFRGGLVTELSLQKLVPNHAYRLCLNGKPDLVGNELLLTPVPGHEAEKYYDFLTIRTDANGEYHGTLGILLQPGNYHVRFYVKDTEDFQIILYHDYFKFTVN